MFKAHKLFVSLNSGLESKKESVRNREGGSAPREKELDLVDVDGRPIRTENPAFKHIILRPDQVGQSWNFWS